MTAETKSNEQETKNSKIAYRGGASDAVYAFGLFGAWFYYISTATTFWEGLLGLLKGFFWPGFLVYELLKYLNL
jgi:hypothetical protein